MTRKTLGLPQRPVELFQPPAVLLEPWPDGPHRRDHAGRLYCDTAPAPAATPAPARDGSNRRVLVEAPLTDEQFAAMVDAARAEVSAILRARGLRPAA